MEELFSLGLAKFPPDQVPALIEEMKQARGLVTSQGGAAPQAREAYIEVLAAGEGVTAMLVAGQEFDIVVVDHDLDDAGYGLFGGLENKARAFTARQVPLTERQRQIQEDSQVAMTTLFPNGNGIFNYGFLQEWNAVLTLLERAKKWKGMPERIARLGLTDEIERLQDCFVLLGRLLGISPQEQSSQTHEVGLARFEEAIRQLIGAVVVNYGKKNDEHRRWQEILLGPYRGQVELYQKRRKKQGEP